MNNENEDFWQQSENSLQCYSLEPRVSAGDGREQKDHRGKEAVPRVTGGCRRHFAESIAGVKALFLVPVSCKLEAGPLSAVQHHTL